MQMSVSVSFAITHMAEFLNIVPDITNIQISPLIHMLTDLFKYIL